MTDFFFGMGKVVRFSVHLFAVLWSNSRSHSGVLENSFLRLLFLSLPGEGDVFSSLYNVHKLAFWMPGTDLQVLKNQPYRYSSFSTFAPSLDLFTVVSTFRTSSTRISQGDDTQVISSQGHGSLFAFGNIEQVYRSFCRYADCLFLLSSGNKPIAVD